MRVITRSRDNSQKKKCSNVSSYNYEKPKDENFSIYAKTDLDQPTDYSLRYAENDSDSDSQECVNIEKTRTEFVGDTVKTYCTEGTPYETPFNFSTSTDVENSRDFRMSDKNNSDNDKNAASGCKTKEVLSDRLCPCRKCSIRNTTTGII
ncbi:hypothetical protein WA026_019306 [Henosepilachna vigintioctopunctata]|uniref:Uncharacterized protein n=1 Tax=Henosepilachna vigintioctopunctata TaxID=420089 RepID=A0AAW1UCI2_9CUCU